MTDDLQFARRVVRTASRLGRTIQREMTGEALEKKDQSPVTVADFSIQAVIARALADTFPEDPLVGEEGSDPLKSEAGGSTLERVVEFVGSVHENAVPSSVCDWIDRGDGAPCNRFWTLDPVDGTKGFLRGDQYSIALALIEDGRVQLGVLGCPNLEDGQTENPSGPGTIAWARRGDGAYQKPLFEEDSRKQLSVSDTTDPRDGVLVRSFESDHTDVDLLQRLVEHLDVQAEPVPLDSQVKYTVLARGAGDIYFRLLSPQTPGYRENIWDHAAGMLIVEEAGGTVTDLDGRELDFSTGRRLTENVGVLATNGALHEPSLNALEAEENRSANPVT